MRVLIDIKHPAQLNLFKGLSKELSEEHWDVTICYLKRGKLPKIVETEYDGFDTIPVGGSNGSRWSILWNGNIKRTLTFLNLLSRNKYDICVAASSIPLAVACKLSGVPIIQFYDDPERKAINSINAALSNQLFFPPIVDKGNKISVFNCLKEWSYLSPGRFEPDLSALKKYDLLPREYIFVREVSNKSFNYYGQEDGIVCSISNEIDKNIKVLLSLEDKSISQKFPDHWTILQEPVTDIHSLIYYSRLMVSSGDSMAREGAMLGIPSIYCGTRFMKANQMLIDLGALNHLPMRSAIPEINYFISKSFDEGEQLLIRNNLYEKWDDMIDFMKEKINQFRYE